MCKKCGVRFDLADGHEHDGAVICKPCSDRIQQRLGESYTDAWESPCVSCGATVASNAAFCARCGAPKDMPIEKQVGTSEAVRWLSVYAEAAGNLVRTGAAALQVQSLGAAGHQIPAAEAQRMLGVVAQEVLAANAVIAEAREHLQNVDGQLLSRIRDEMLRNSQVLQSSKSGLAFDPAELFGPRGNFDAIVASTVADSMTAAPSFVQPAPQRESLPSRSSSNLRSGTRPVGIYVCVAFVGIALLFGYLCLAEARSENGFSTFAKVTGAVALVLGICGLMGIGSCCSHCWLMFTEEDIGSQCIDSHMETRTETRVAHHFDRGELHFRQKTLYEVDVPVHVQRFVHTKRCSNCGYTWQVTEKQET